MAMITLMCPRCSNLITVNLREGQQKVRCSACKVLGERTEFEVKKGKELLRRNPYEGMVFKKI